MTIAVDFDGTIVEHKYPEIGKEKPFAIQTLRTLQQEGNRIILFTSREGELLEDAVAYCHKKGLDFFAVNSNQPADALFPRQTSKVIADVYIDDKNLGGLPDWTDIYRMINGQRAERHAARKKKFRLFGGK
ncbi:MAG: hypothetical protein SPK87_07670 [Bacteroidales bacterium]|jgi:hypothetical protein|nr:hypothetical protein [Bacteroidales bacterium]